MDDDVLLLYDDVMLEHDTGPGHPERAERLRSIRDALQDQPVQGTRWTKPKPAMDEQIELVHTIAHIKHIESLRGKSFSIDADTLVSPKSVEAAHIACGPGRPQPAKWQRRLRVGEAARLRDRVSHESLLVPFARHRGLLQPVQRHSELRARASVS